MDGQDKNMKKQMDGWMDKKYMKKIRMVGWIKNEKIDGWLDGQKEKIYEKNMDGWMDKKMKN